MTLDELDVALNKLGLDVKGNPKDAAIRDEILIRHGRDFLQSKSKRCKDCWLKEHGKCGPMCQMYTPLEDPLEVSKAILSKFNNIKLFPFLFLYMIPVYEEVTGNKDTVKKIAREFKRRWKTEKGDAAGLPSFD